MEPDTRSETTHFIAAAVGMRDAFWMALEADGRLGPLGWSLDESASGDGELSWSHPERAGRVRWAASDPEQVVRDRDGVISRGTLSEMLVVLVHERD